MRPLRDMIILAGQEKKTETESGIFLGKATVEPGIQPGVVVAVGPDVTNVKVGDTVYPNWSASKMVSAEPQRVAIKEVDILAVID